MEPTSSDTRGWGPERMTENQDRNNKTPEGSSEEHRKKVWIRRAVGTAVGTIVGGIAGYLWCGISGSCPLTSNPAIAAVAGGIFGLLWTLDR